jgi:hypothetical protein
VVTVVTCTGLLAACRSGDEGRKAGSPASARPTAAASGGPASQAPSSAVSPTAGASAASPTPGASAACPSRAEIADAVSAADHSSGVIVGTKVVCRDGWATAQMRYPGADPARVIVRRQNGEVRLVTYGTDGLCESPRMKKAPTEIKKALGPYC